ncbi:MAG: rod shape-determining protein RodA [Spirochaetales bacterium]|nr:rod shape-determining protein RodA [Spirochaetales bacterium]MBP7262589.1 rod shape-determining protein RodA [Spirochaetia bacterium]
MSSIKVFARSLDWIVVASVAVLMAIGVMFIYSSGMTSDGQLVSTEYAKQIVWALSGLGLMLAAALIDPKRLPEYVSILYVGILVVLVYTRIFGRVVNGARSWLGFGDLGIQPSEFMKIATILFLSRYLEESAHERHSFRRFAISLGIVAIPMLLILSQPDFGTALVFLPVYLGMAFMADVSPRYLWFLILTASIVGVLTVMPLWQTLIAADTSVALRMFYEAPYVYYVLVAAVLGFGLSVLGYRLFKKRYYYWMAYVALVVIIGLGASMLGRKVLKEYQVMRLVVFLDPSVDPLGSGWNILQSITAIGSGGFSGKGFLQGTQSHYRYLPQQSTDFIFSIISEELGFIGGIVVFSLFMLVSVRLILASRTVNSPFQRGVLAGMFSMVLFHFMVNAGMAMGIMPITGIPLLFLSYGGSSLWAACIGLGLSLGISARRYES